MFRSSNQRRGTAQRRPRALSASQRPVYGARPRPAKKPETPIAALAFVRLGAADPKLRN
jgi:hypothetical protein